MVIIWITATRGRVARIGVLLTRRSDTATPILLASVLISGQMIAIVVAFATASAAKPTLVRPADLLTLFLNSHFTNRKIPVRNTVENTTERDIIKLILCTRESSLSRHNFMQNFLKFFHISIFVISIAIRY